MQTSSRDSEIEKRTMKNLPHSHGLLKVGQDKKDGVFIMFWQLTCSPFPVWTLYFHL